MSEATDYILRESRSPKTEAKEAWFKSYCQGNVSWPQSYLGITLFGLKGVLDDPPTSWGQYLNSKFSADQYERLGKIMSNVHHQRGIKMATEKHLHSGDKTIHHTDLDILWHNGKVKVTKLILGYISLSEGLPILSDVYKYSKLDNDKKCEVIDAFFQDLRNSKKIQELKDFSNSCIEGFESEDGKNFLKTRRELVIKGNEGWAKEERRKNQDQAEGEIIKHLKNKRLAALIPLTEQ